MNPLKTFQDAARAFENGNLKKAAKLIKQVQSHAPNEPAVLHLDGLISLKGGNYRSAVRSLEQLIKIEPDVNRINVLANAYVKLGRHEDAIEVLKGELDNNPAHVDTLYNLANYLVAVGEISGAIDHYRRALQHEPGFQDALYNLGNAFVSLGQDDEAISAFRKCLNYSPDDAEVLTNLGNALLRTGQHTEAVNCLERAVQLSPNDPAIRFNLANAHSEVSNPDAALEQFNAALELDPDDPKIFNNKALLLKDLGDVPTAIKLLEEAVSKAPESLLMRSSLIFCKHNSPEYEPDELLHDATQWYEQCVKNYALDGAQFSRRSMDESRVKVGYISGDLRQHPVGFFFEPVFLNHDRDRFEIHVYCTSKKSDSVTERIRKHVDEWHDVTTIDPAELAQLCHRNEIDILLDLAGHTDGNRLETLCHRPAPVLIVAGGHYSTSGLGCVDGLIADRWECPDGSDRHYSEPLIRMPNDYTCYLPPEYAPDIVDAPCNTSGDITFGCFNNLAKISPQVVEVWSKILHRVPDSRILLKTTMLKSEHAKNRLVRLFNVHEISENRILLEEGLPHREFLAEYGRVDIALDPFPYSGGLTTLEALLMGVPVVTLSGKTFAARHSTSHLSNVGLEHLVTPNLDAYIDKAVSLTSDFATLNEMRPIIREKLLESPICDGVRYTRDLEDIFCRLRKNWISDADT